jgi:hypothetical protein
MDPSLSTSLTEPLTDREVAAGVAICYENEDLSGVRNVIYSSPWAKVIPGDILDELCLLLLGFPITDAHVVREDVA